MKRVILLRSNPVNPDPPVEKAALALLKAGYDVKIIGWDRDSDYALKKDVTVWYLSKHILHRPLWRFLLKLACNLLVSGILINRMPIWVPVAATDIFGLFICAIKVSAIVFPVFLAVNALLSVRTIKEEIQRKKQL